MGEFEQILAALMQQQMAPKRVQVDEMQSPNAKAIASAINDQIGVNQDMNVGLQHYEMSKPKKNKELGDPVVPDYGSW